MQAVLDKLALLIRARYPLVHLLTHEEERVERGVERLAAREGLEVWRWRSTSGLVGPDGTVDGTEALPAALDAIGLVGQNALFLLFDPHPFLEWPEVVRRLRDLAHGLGGRNQALLLVGASLGVPLELDKELAVLDVPLPGREEVGKLLGLLLKSQNIEVPPALFERFVRGSLGLTEREIKRLYARILLAGGRFVEEDLAALGEEKRQAIRKSRFLEFWEMGGRMDNVGGLDNLKQWLTRRALGFSDRAKAFGLPEPRGLFLLGVQGCGKSLIAKAIADLWRFPLLRLDVAAVFQGRARQEESLRETVRVAESLAPVVLWIDELEKGLVSAGQSGGEALGFFLTWMQEKTAPVFVVATANEVRNLPPELLRKGRFDEIFFVDLPNVHERLSVLEIHIRNRGRQPESFDLTPVAEETEKFSGAELEQVVVAALFNAFATGRELASEDLLDCAREMIPLAVTMDDRLKELREWARPRARPASLDRRRIDFFEEWE